MKKSPFCLSLVAVVLSFPAFGLVAVDLRADDQVPPVPPGNSLPPPAPSTTSPTTSSKSSAVQSAGGKKGQAGGDANQRLEKLKEELKLTPKQVARIKPIFDRTAQQVKTLRTSVSLSAAQKKQQIREIVTASAQQIRPILTPQQLQKWKQIREQRRSQSPTQTAST